MIIASAEACFSCIQACSPPCYLDEKTEHLTCFAHLLGPSILSEHMLGQMQCFASCFACSMLVTFPAEHVALSVVLSLESPSPPRQVIVSTLLGHCSMHLLFPLLCIWDPKPASAPPSLLAMGSLGWAQCYWCGWWQEGMYIPDGIDHGLCEYCLWERWGPPQPDARARLCTLLLELVPEMPCSAAWEIACFCHEWHEP